MTPQETAKSLYEDFYHLMPRTLSEKERHDTAKLCALKHLQIFYAESYPTESHKHWKLVKQEIHKL